MFAAQIGTGWEAGAAAVVVVGATRAMSLRTSSAVVAGLAVLASCASVACS